MLRKGRIMAANLDGATVTDTAELARMMVGHDIALNLERVTTAQADAILEVHGLSRDLPGIRAPFREVSFSVRQGEVFSVTGVAGNGQSDLAAVLGGMKTGAKGTVILKGRRMAAGRWNPAKHDAAYVPEDRYQTGSVPDMSLTDNFLLSFFQEHSKGGLLQRREARRKTENLLKEYGVAATGPEARAGSLSGGNLQKFILGRELSRKPVLFIAEQPTQGLDVQAVADIWQTITRAKQHMAVLLFTNDLEEALALSDRIGVMFRGRMLDILDVDMPTATAKAALVERIGLLMAGMVLPDKPGQGARP
ncbi:MAG: ATP-binding cassette domain-containing protein [Desulfovibrio sp.]|nr:MAG: ATP-binding cassette domain-containing protein [Desulfovibrio sp.]